MIPPEDGRAIDEILAPGLHEGVGRSLAGREFPVEWAVGRLDLDRQRFFTITTRDLSESRKLESQLRQAQKLESVGQLAAGVAHEINTPVQFVGDSIDFLGDAFTDLRSLALGAREITAGHPELRKELEALEEEADLGFLLDEVPAAVTRCIDGVARVAGIVRAMKEFAHPGSETKQAADLNEAIRTTATVATNEYKYVATLDLELGEIPRVHCHIGDLNQVVLNLIVNAAHAIEDCGLGAEDGRITIRTQRDGGHVVLSLSDNGAGIPEAARERIFDPFFTTKEVGRGSGQGLALAYSTIVDKHDGEIDFESELGVGTTFHLRIPIGEVAA